MTSHQKPFLFRQLFDQKTWTFTYLLADLQTREALLIDPVLEQKERDLNLIRQLDLELKYCLDTHVHADHVTGSGELRKTLGIQTVLSNQSGVGCADILLEDGETLDLGKLKIEARHTPGHTNGCASYILRIESEFSEDEIFAFTGDALLIRGCGRTDFQQGSPQALYHSIHEKIFTLPDHTKIYPGHDYRGHTSSTVGEEKKHNPRLMLGISESEFVDIMNHLDLPNPKFMETALPLNLACGNKSLEPQSNQSKTEQPFEEHAITQISADEANNRLQSFQVVDVREEEELTNELGHIPLAFHCALSQLEECKKKFTKDQHLLLVCRSGNRSSQAASSFKEWGFNNIFNLQGGMLSWNANGFPTCHQSFENKKQCKVKSPNIKHQEKEALSC